MGCIVELTHSDQAAIRFDFCANQYKQKIWIDVLLKHSTLDMAGLAGIIEVTVETLKLVQQGDSFLSGESANHLGQLFLIFFSD